MAPTSPIVKPADAGKPATVASRVYKKKADIDVRNATRGVWIVKVPKYIENKWQKAPSTLEVAKLRIVRDAVGPKPQVCMTLSESLFCLDNDTDTEPIPKRHMLDLTPVTRQCLGVYSGGGVDPRNDDMSTHLKLMLEGKIVQRLECRPQADEKYMKMKLESIKKAHIPARTVKQLDKVVQTYKPVSNHKYLKDYEDKKKAEGKRSRDDKSAVLEMLFQAFEKHQYYNLKDLVDITRQPVSYLKEVLKEVCNHNMKNPHRNMWELKPEYRHYKNDEDDDGSNK